MRMLIALTLLLTSFFVGSSTSHPPDQTHFLNDGTFYKLDPKEQHVHWHSDLGQKLISFQLTETQNNFQNQLSTYFIPTIQGHFVYIDKNKEILVHRQEIQPLLKICFGKSNDNLEIVLASQQQYFLHQKYEYLFIDLHIGKIWNIQQFFAEKIVSKTGKHALIKISKKYLKQLRPNLQVKWSSISSTIDIVSAIQFLKNPKLTILNDEFEAENYEFRRISNHELQVVERVTEKTFQMGGKSPIMTVFSYDKNFSLFQKHPITFHKKPILAIEDKHETTEEKIQNQIAKAEVNVFPHASEYKEGNRSDKKYTNFEFNRNSQFDFEYCLNTFRAIQQLSSDAGISTNIPFQKEKLQIQGSQRNPQNLYPGYSFLPTEQISPTSHPHLFHEPQRSKQQPLIWIFIIGSLIASGGIFYRLKVGKLLTQLQKLETQHDKRFEQIQKRLGQFEQMQKMYEVYWDKLLYRKPRRKSSDVFEVLVASDEVIGQKVTKPNQIEMYEHLVFEGKFLNKEALVYAVPLDGIDLIHVEHQLNDLLSCSHKSLVKLYYYTKNSQFLLIFCQKINPLWESIESSSFFSKFQIVQQDKTLRNIQNLVNSKYIEKPIQILENEDSSPKTQEKHKQIKPKKFSQVEIIKKLAGLIQEIIDSITYLDSKIDFFSIPLEGIILNERTLVSSEKDLQKLSSASSFEIQLKINTIPSILQVYKQDEDLSEEAKIKSKHNMNIKLRHDLVKIFYSINTRGQKSNIKAIYSMISKNENSDGDSFFVKDFYDFVLNENYSLNIEMDNADKGEIKEEDKKAVRVLGKNHEFLQKLSCHPFLWDSKRKMLFLSDFSNYIETYLDDYKIKKFESSSRDYQIIDTPWTKHLDLAFVREINQFRKYDFNSVRDLIRLIRNKVNHFHEIPRDTRNSIGKTPEAFIEYMLKLYPKILSFAFVYAKKKKWKLHVQIK